MDLLKVKVDNFRCFQGIHELDMTDGPLWIVRGENGSGKSTLVCDSILFALFNTIPSLEGTQSLKKTDLINLKHKSMSVQIWFNHNGNRFSIRRSYMLKGKSDQLHHQFEAWQNNKEIINTPKQDEARIFVTEKFWEIEDFRNTTIVLQKEITNSVDQRESERKKSIEKIFNIERFAKMSELAHKHSRDTAIDIKVASTSIDEIKKQIVNEEELKEKKFTAQELLKTTTTQKNSIEEELQKKKSIKENLDRAVLQGNNLKERIQQKNTDLSYNEKEKQIHENELKVINADLEKEQELLLRLSKIEQLEKFLEGANKIVETISNKERERDSYVKLIYNKEQSLQNDLNQLQSTKVFVTKQIESIKNELESLKQTEALIPKLSEIVKTLPDLKMKKDHLAKELENAEILEKTIFEKEKSLELQKNVINDQLKELTKKSVTLKSLEDEKKNSENEINKSKVIGKQLEQETEDLEELLQKEQEIKNVLFRIDNEIELLKNAIKEVNMENTEIKSLDTEGVCPKCKQKLSATHISDITQENNRKLKDLEQKVNDNNSEKTTLENDLVKLNKLLISKKKSQKELDEIKSKFTAERTKLESITKQILSLTGEMMSLLEIKEKFDKNQLFTGPETEILQLKRKSPATAQLKLQKKEIEEKILEVSKQETHLSELNNRLGSKLEKESMLKSILKNLDEINRKFDSQRQLLDTKQFAVEESKILKQIEQQIEELKKNVPGIEKTKQELKNLEPEQTRTKLKTLDKQKGIREEKTKRIGAINKNLSAIKSEIQDLNDQLNQLELEKVIPDVENYKIAITELEKQLADSNKMLIKLEIELQSIADQIAKNNQYMNEYKLKNAEYESLKNRKDDYDLLENLFKDIGKRILNRVMNRINLYSTEILGRLGNDQLEQISLVESKSGFELKIISGGEERYPNWFSGGQKVRIGLAFRLSLSKTLAEVTGGDIETILIDEGDFGALDEQGLKGVADILNELKTFFKRMVIVTHMDHLANELDGRRLLIKDSKIIQENQILN